MVKTCKLTSIPLLEVTTATGKYKHTVSKPFTKDPLPPMSSKYLLFVFFKHQRTKNKLNWDKFTELAKNIQNNMYINIKHDLGHLDDKAKYLKLTKSSVKKKKNHI